MASVGHGDLAHTHDAGGEVEPEGLKKYEPDADAELQDFVRATAEALEEFVRTARAVMREDEDAETMEEIAAVEDATAALQALLNIWRRRRTAAGAASGL